MKWSMECPTHSTVSVDDDFFAVTELAGFPVMVAPDDFLEFIKDSGYSGDVDIKEFMDLFYDWLED